MAAGKSTIGPLLAAQLGYDYCDTDAMIVEEIGMSISAYFSTAGESSFRDLEHQMLRRLSSLDDVVISTGGGLPLYHDPMAQMLSSGIVVYIKASIADIVQRLQEDDSRPMLQRRTGALRRFVARHYGSRRTYYRRAQIIVWNRGNPTAVVDRIAKQVMRHE